MSEPHQKNITTCKKFRNFCNSLLPVFICNVFLHKRQQHNNKDNETQTAADNAFAQSTANDAVAMSSESEDNGVTGTITDSTVGLMFNTQRKHHSQFYCFAKSAYNRFWFCQYFML